MIRLRMMQYIVLKFTSRSSFQCIIDHVERYCICLRAAQILDLPRIRYYKRKICVIFIAIWWVQNQQKTKSIEMRNFMSLKLYSQFESSESDELYHLIRYKKKILHEWCKSLPQEQKRQRKWTSFHFAVPFGSMIWISSQNTILTHEHTVWMSNSGNNNTCVCVCTLKWE